MNLFDAFILGIVEGITEFLPISSTGHLILTAHLLGIPSSDVLKSFEIIIQLGAIGAVLVLYYRSFFNIELLKKLFVAFLPTAIIGLALYSFVKQYLLGNEKVVLISLFVGGITLIVFELLHKEKETSLKDVSSISYTQAFTIGLFQSIAIIPGVSRSAATIVGGLSMNISRTTIIEFSFLLAVPTMGAATALDLLKNYATFSPHDFSFLAVGFVTAFIVALFAIKFLLRFMRTHTFIPFGVYRIAIALLFWVFLIK